MRGVKWHIRRLHYYQDPRINPHQDLCTSYTFMKYINAKSCRELALHLAAQHRAHGFNRVSKEFLERVDVRVRNLILSEVTAHPSKGKTLK